MRVLVCGGREFSDRDRVFEVLGGLDRIPSMIIQGGAIGADTFAREWAEAHGVLCQTFEADRETLGRSAGPIRNKQMLEVGQPDLVVAFPGARGTANMVRQAKAAGVRVLEVWP